MSIALNANIDFSSYQFRPLLKFFGDAQRRVLIADETGLGKTIEAGMILAEVLAAAGENACVVILCPNGISWKWCLELRTKFGIRAFKSSFRDFKDHIVPAGVHVISQDARSTESNISLPDNSIDLLIIDEIHNYIGRQGDQKRRSRAKDLSNVSKGVIGLSATPIQIEAEDLRAILDLIAPGEHTLKKWDNQVLIQTAVNKVILAQRESNGANKKEIDILKKKWPKKIKLDPDELLYSLSRERWSALELDIRAMGPIGLRMTRARARDSDVKGADGKTMFRERRIFTEIVSRNKYDSLISDIDNFLKENMHFSNRRQFASCPSAAKIILNNCEKSDLLDSLISRHENNMPNDGPKYNYLANLLNELSLRNDVTKTIIFTHWRPTFWQLKKLRVTSEIKIFSIDPDWSEGQISNEVDKFRDYEEYAALLVTDKMSEGIDLDMANTIINVDLPYNPAKLQQRIGRLDRYIQESAFIEVYNLILEKSIEEEQVRVLENRLKVFETIIGGYESIISSKEMEDDWTEGEMKKIISNVTDNNDMIRLAESNVILHIMDSALDNEIVEKRAKLHPINSNLYLIIKYAMKHLGAKTTWDKENNELKIQMSESLRRRLLNSKVFFPWNGGRIMAAFEVPNDIDKDIIIQMSGRNATLGPLDPFLLSCENLLFNVEGFFGGCSEIISPKMVGTKDNVNKWTIKIADKINQMDSGEIITNIINKNINISEWKFNKNEIWGLESE